jgi:ABC-type uncharacterized transport system auxiliary subunit
MGGYAMIRKTGHQLQFLILLVLCACGLPKTRYYSMELPHAPKATGPVISHQLTVQRFRANQMLMDDRIMYRESPVQVNFYEYHRWANPPVDLATQHVIHRLKDSGAFSLVTMSNDGPPPDLILRGRLHKFEEVDRGKEVQVAFALELELVDGKSRTPIWREEGECLRPVTTRDMPGVVQGLYDCMDEVCGRLLLSMQETTRKMK